MIDTVIDIVKRAGEIALEHRKKYEVETKKDNSIVTSADLAVDSFIIEQLTKHFPDDQIMTEETEDTVEEYSGRIWVVDPIDGTKGFVNDGDWSIIVGLLEGGRPVLGVVYDVQNRKVYRAEAGNGAYCGEKRLSVTSTADLSKAILTTQEAESRPRPLDTKATEKAADAVPFYSTGLQLCALAEGKTDVLLKFSPRSHKWDTCAGQAILEEAGGRITLPSGEPLDYTKKETQWRKGFVATNGVIHQKALELFTSLTPSES